MIQFNQRLKKDFPVFRNNPGLVFLDSGASAQKPQAVIDKVREVYEQYYANVHRGIYSLSERSSEEYEAVRGKTAQLINAASEKNIIFTRNTTESINLVAYTWGRRNIRAGDEILLTEMEHHANMLPWRWLAKEKKARIVYWPVNDSGRLTLRDLDSLVTKRTKLIAFTHMSNVLGTINPAKEIVRRIRSRSQALVLIDGAQSVPHFPVDVTAIGCDFYAFSSHKMLGPAGVGVLYGREAILQAMDPFLYGGDMIANVTFQTVEWNEVPFKFEAGTPNIAGVIGFGAAIDYLQKVGLRTIERHEAAIVKVGLKKFSELPGVTLLGPHDAKDRGAVFAFVIDGVHPHDSASVFDEMKVCIRAGHHCTQPLHEKYGLSASNRASFYLYNGVADFGPLIAGIRKSQRLFT